MQPLLAPGLQISDGRLYQDGLVTSWRAHLPEDAAFPLAFKVRQSFDTGWRVALVEALAYGVSRIHVALIPNWYSMVPDWKWLHATIRELADMTGSSDAEVFVRLGNYRDGKVEGITFDHHARHELAFRDALPARFRWAVGDDRGLVGSLDGWKVRRQVFGSVRPAMLEAQPYGETSGLTEDHPAAWKLALYRAGYGGQLAFVECHRWFKPQAQAWTDFERLAEAATGEWLLQIFRACANAGIGFMLFTGDTAFNRLDPKQPLNPAGRALFDKPRPEVEPWSPPLFRRMLTTWRLGSA